MDALSCIDQCFISDETLEQLPVPFQVGKTKVGGIDFNQARMRRVAEAVLALAASPGWFTAPELARQVRTISEKAKPSTVHVAPPMILKAPRQTDHPAHRQLGQKSL